MSSFQDRLDQLAAEETAHATLVDPSQTTTQARSRSVVMRAAAGLLAIVGLTALAWGAWGQVGTTPEDSLTVTTDSTGDTGATASDQATGLRLPVTIASIQARRYGALVNSATNELVNPCMRSAGFQALDVDTFGAWQQNTPPNTPLAVLERLPFSPDGGYLLVDEQVNRPSSSLGVEANQLIDRQLTYIDGLSSSDRVDYDVALTACREDATDQLHGGPSSGEQFYDLLNEVVNLSAGPIVERDPTVETATIGWRACMAQSGHSIDSRDAAIQLSFDERAMRRALQPPTEAPTPPAPTELALATADRVCSHEVDFTQIRWNAWLAAEVAMFDDAATAALITEWNEVTSELRPQLAAILDAELVGSMLDSDAMQRAFDSHPLDPRALFLTTGPERNTYGFLPSHILEDLPLLQSAIDLGRDRDIARCLQRRGWDVAIPPAQLTQAPLSGDPLTSLLTDMGDIDPRAFGIQTLGGIARNPSGGQDDRIEADTADCLSRSDWNLSHPLGAVFSGSYGQASELVQSDPAFLSAQQRAEACRSEARPVLNDQATVDAEAFGLLSRRAAGSITDEELRLELPSLVERREAALAARRACDQELDYGPVFDAYFAELATADEAMLDSAVAELERFIAQYRPILDELHALEP